MITFYLRDDIVISIDSMLKMGDFTGPDGWKMAYISCHIKYHFMNPSKWLLALFAMAGAAAPDILILYSKRWSMPQVSFSVVQYATASLLYLGLTAVVSLIFPYKKVFKNSENLSWKAFCVGFSLPVVLSTVAALSRSQLVAVRGGNISGTLHDLLSLF